MSKLLKLKKWLTLDEAVLHIATSISEDVTIQDLYQFAVDEYLKLSVYFVNGAYGAQGKWLNANDIDWQSGIHNINGVWDLTMRGQEALEVKELYEQSNSGLGITTLSKNGILLQQDDVVCQLYKYFEPDNIFNPQFNESVKRRREIAEHPMKALENSPFIISKLLRKNDVGVEFIPCNKFIEQDGKLVIRTSEITRFIQSLEDTPQEAKPLRCKERNSLLVLIGALCRNADIDPMKRGVSSSLEKMTDELGAHLDVGTIRTILAQIEPAISSKS